MYGVEKSPGWKNPKITSPDLKSLDFSNPATDSPDLKSPKLKSQDLKSLVSKNPKRKTKNGK